MKKKIYAIRIFRIVLQLLFFLILPFVVTVTFDGLRSIFVAIFSGSFNLISQLPKIMNVLFIMLISIFFGRFFCGWICAFGTIGDLAFLFAKKIFKFKIKINEKLDFNLKFVKYIILLICIILIWLFNVAIFKGVSPWDSFGQIPNIPLALKDLIMNGILHSKTPPLKLLFTDFLIGSIIFAIIILFSLFVERFFCRYLCPLGAFFAIISKLRIIKINKPNEHCGKCKICTNNCSMGIQLYKSNVIHSGECIDCMNCTTVCPRNNLSLAISDTNINPIIASTVAVASIIGTHYLWDYAKNTAYVTALLNSDSTATANPLIQVSTGSTKKYKDGVYTGVGAGYRPNLNVTVTIKGDLIVNITVGANNEEPGYREEPIRIIPNKIIASQSANVSAVSGATYTSNGIMDAVANALNKAVISGSISTTSTTRSRETTAQQPSSITTSKFIVASHKYVAGSYTGTAMGFEGNIRVTVTVNTSSITNIKINSQMESKPRNALSAIPQSILASQSTNVAAVSGATYTSNGIMNAVASALNKAVAIPSATAKTTIRTQRVTAPPPTVTTRKTSTNGQGNKYIAGTYSGVAAGFNPNLNVTVTVNSNSITNITIGSNNETRQGTSFTVIPQRIISAQSTNVAAVSGATYSSNGIMNAVANALNKAIDYGNPSNTSITTVTTLSTRRTDDDD